jgi:hypothetical protein
MCSYKNSDMGTATPHAAATYLDWVGLQSRRQSSDHVLVNGHALTIADVVAVSL